MGKIFYLMGKSASGKDTLFKRIMELVPELKTIVLYTTRPIRDGEEDGVEYHFADEERLQKIREGGQLIEARTYQTACGPWSYFTVDDGQFDLGHFSFLMIGTLESYEKMREYFGPDLLVPLYVEVEDSIRLQRALDRERLQTSPKYKELCRRFLADEEDFKEENLNRLGVTRRYQNDALDSCLGEMVRDITASMEQLKQTGNE